MLCPQCPNTMLVMADRSGIEIDYCPKCRGVWLDRGELDKIVERSTQMDARQVTPPPSPGAYQQPPPQQGYRKPDDSDYGMMPPTGSGYPQQQGYPLQRRKKSWLGELFD